MREVVFRFQRAELQKQLGMQNLRSAITQMIKISEADASQFMGFCYRKSFKKKVLLSDDDKFIDEVYFYA